MTFSEVAPADLGAAELYSVLTRSVVPRPIAFVSSVSASGVRNLAPFSYFMLGGGAPPSLAFSPVARAGVESKDTLSNIEATGEYTVNLVTREIVSSMNLTAAEFGSDVDEWEISGLEPALTSFVKPAFVALSPVGFACKLFQVVRHGDLPGAARYVIGEVVGLRLRSDVLGGAGVDTVARLGGAGYLDTAVPEVFELVRPKA